MMAEYIEREAAVCIRGKLEIEKSADVAPQWISVKDRLPEAGQEVLAISHGWGDRLVYVGQRKKMEAQTSPLTGITSKASDWLLWGWSYIREPQVTHWMPLPEPPKGEADDI